jgi:ATP-binding cassette, subfamily B, bacterial
MSTDFYEEEDFVTRFTGKTFLRIAEQLRPHWKWALTFFIGILVVAGLDAVFTYISKQAIDLGIVAKNIPVMVQYYTYYAILILVQAGFVFALIYSAGILGERIRYDLRKGMFNYLQDLSLSYFSRTPVGWIMARVTSDSERVADLVTWGLVDSSWAVMSILTSMIFMFIINWKLAMIVLLILPVLIWVAIVFRKRILREYRDVRKNNSRITGAYNETITGVRVIKALGREEENREEFGGITDRMYQSSYRAAWWSALFLPVVQIISSMAIAATVWYGGVVGAAGGMTIGAIQAFVSYITFMMWPVQDLARVYAEMQQAIASAERIFSLRDSVPEVVERKVPVDPGTMRGTIEFKNIFFSYSDAKDVPVICGVNLKVNAGETIALVGPTGGGKTTLVNLLCRFYEPSAGMIKIGGKDYTGFPLQAIQSRIGIVLQTPHLFSGTVRENLRYGRLNANDQEIEEAARLAGAHDFITHLSKGYEENVGEGGNLLSVGQKQLISLARAVLSNPEIFIMDEATSSVDTLTEALIQKGMETLMKGRTSFIIAHRLSTIRRADRILVIEAGRIAESGSHAELLRKRGKYFQLYTRQFRQEKEVEYIHLSSEASPLSA